ncbi:hypothetical protein OTU49_000516, partial [Cherax quadricarinatus]
RGDIYGGNEIITIFSSPVTREEQQLIMENVLSEMFESPTFPNSSNFLAGNLARNSTTGPRPGPLYNQRQPRNVGIISLHQQENVRGLNRSQLHQDPSQPSDDASAHRQDVQETTRESSSDSQNSGSWFRHK